MWMKNLQCLSTAEIAEIFRWDGDGKETKKLRWKAYRHWLNAYREKYYYKKVETLPQEYKKAAENMDFALTLQNAEICRTMKIVGMTTTAAAKHAKLIEELGCKIIIAEEAAQVHESHLVSVWGPHV